MMPTRSPEATTINSTNQYLDEMGGYELLTAEEEVELAKCMEEGKKAEAILDELNGDGTEEKTQVLTETVLAGQAARERFINSNLRLVVANVRKFAHKPDKLDFNDLIQEGNIGLHTAVDKFDWRKGFKFSTYATWWIRQAINRGVSGQDRTIRLPVAMEAHISTLYRSKQDFIVREGREPTDAELVKESGLPEGQVKKALNISDMLGDVVSYDAPVGNEVESSERIDFIEDTGVNVEAEAISELVEGSLLDIADKCLNEKEKQVILKRYGVDGSDVHTLDEIGKMLGVTRERIRQIESAAKDKLKAECIKAGLY